MIFDPLYLILMLPGILLATWASFYTKSTFQKYSNAASEKGFTGARAAELLLHDAGIFNVRVEKTGGFLSDHYDPGAKVLRLSPDVFESRSLSAIGVACHEAGHAIQHAAGYAPLAFRNMIVPLVSLCSPLSYVVIVLGVLVASQELMMLGIFIFCGVVFFSLITLPVEWDASSRAKQLMVSRGIVSQNEGEAAGQVLNAAFLTYVAALVNSLLTLLYFLLRTGILGGRRD